MKWSIRWSADNKLMVIVDKHNVIVFDTFEFHELCREIYVICELKSVSAVTMIWVISVNWVSFCLSIGVQYITISMTSWPLLSRGHKYNKTEYLNSLVMHTMVVFMQTIYHTQIISTNINQNTQDYHFTDQTPVWVNNQLQHFSCQLYNRILHHTETELKPISSTWHY